jgi:hypothetical protein
MLAFNKVKVVLCPEELFEWKGIHQSDDGGRVTLLKNHKQSHKIQIKAMNKF